MPKEHQSLTSKFTDAQLEVLMNAVERAAMYCDWKFHPEAENRPGLQRRTVYGARQHQCVSAPEQTILSIARRGGAERFEKGSPWPHSFWLLTREGILAGLAEYKRRKGKDLVKVAQKAQADKKKAMDAERRVVKEIAKPFRGMNIRIGEGKQRKSKDLGVHIEKTIMGKGTATTVDFDRSMLEQLGKRIDALREAPPRKT